MEAIYQFGVDADTHLPATGVHVGRTIVIQLQHRPVGRRRLGEPLDLVAEHGDSLPGRLDCGRQLLVSCIGTSQLAAGVTGFRLQEVDLTGRVDQTATEFGDLVLQTLSFRTFVLEGLNVFGGTASSIPRVVVG